MSAKAKPFYIYRIVGEQNETLYIGKGSGDRLRDQKRRFKSEGEILFRFNREGTAYRIEKRLIEELNPPLNVAPGGCGGRVGMQRNRAPSYKETFFRIMSIFYRGNLGKADACWRMPWSEFEELLTKSVQTFGLVVTINGFRRYGVDLLPAGMYEEVFQPAAQNSAGTA